MARTSLDNNDPLKFYSQELAQIPPLTRDEETNLLRHVVAKNEQAESACMRLIEVNLALVVSIAERYSSAGIPMLDLVQEGNLGLNLALKTFPERSNESFSTHAAKCIEYAVVRAIAPSKSVSE